MEQEERIRKFMQFQQRALEETGIAYAMESGQNLVVFDTQINEPVELEITVGTEIVKEGGRISITTFDRSNVSSQAEKMGDYQ